MKQFTITKSFENKMILAFRKGMNKYGTEISFDNAYDVIDSYKTFNNLDDYIIDFLIDFLMDIVGNEGTTYKTSYDNFGNMVVIEL